jgi:hypothetical protein
VLKYSQKKQTGLKFKVTDCKKKSGPKRKEEDWAIKIQKKRLTKEEIQEELPQKATCKALNRN